MISKIELLQQVLDLEPASRLFFPLAELLYAEGDLAAAERVLRQGVIHHPDHLEAKFFLVQICSRLGRDGEAKALYAPVSELLGRYPAVLELWTRDQKVCPADFPAALAAVSELLESSGKSWADLLRAGFEAVQASEAAPAQAAPEASASPAPKPASQPASQAAPAEPKVKPLPAETVKTRPSPRGGPLPMAGAAEVAALARSLAEEPARPATRVGKASGPSVVTRTMAQLLVGQGDYKGALAIYEELYSQAPDPESKEALAKLIADTRAKLGECVPAEAAQAQAQAQEQEQGGGKKKFLGMLEALAGRLEARG